MLMYNINFLFTDDVEAVTPPYRRTSYPNLETFTQQKQKNSVSYLCTFKPYMMRLMTGGIRINSITIKFDTL